jgi:hypothetical protein
MAFPENQATDGGSSVYADDGSASHELHAMTLASGKDCIDFLGMKISINGREYVFDEERCTRMQGCVDDVRRRAIGGHLFVEQWIDLSDYLGKDQGGTTDVAIALPAKRMGIVSDLKDGSGEKVYASYVVVPATETTEEIREPNPQLGLYALGLLKDLELFGEIDSMLLVINQPKLNHIDEFPISVEDLKAFGKKAAAAAKIAGEMVGCDPQSLTVAGHLNPGVKQCRWCRAQAEACLARLQFVQNAAKADFETIASVDVTGLVPRDTNKLSAIYQAVPFIEQFCTLVKSQLQKLVADGEKVIGPDGQPYKYVEGKEGTRKWEDEKAAEAALLGVLSREKVYTEPKVITAPAAAKLLDKKATKELWKDQFEPLIVRPRTQPVLTIGTDPRPAFSGAAQASDFDETL